MNIRTQNLATKASNQVPYRKCV